jgi:serine/threonine protein kinase
MRRRCTVHTCCKRTHPPILMQRSPLEPCHCHSLVLPSEDYRRLKKLGKGTYGRVYKAMHMPTGVIVALKRLLFADEGQGNFALPPSGLREILVLGELRHRNVLALTGLCYDAQRREPYLVRLAVGDASAAQVGR